MRLKLACCLEYVDDWRLFAFYLSGQFGQVLRQSLLARAGVWGVGEGGRGGGKAGRTTGLS